jgi:hypothetical protein
MPVWGAVRVDEEGSRQWQIWTHPGYVTEAHFDASGFLTYMIMMNYEAAKGWFAAEWESSVAYH